MDGFKELVEKRNVSMDAFLLDDGWDDRDTVCAGTDEGDM